MSKSKVDLTNPIFHDDDAARDHLEGLLWPNGPVCPHCGNADPARITKLKGKSTRPGVHKCKECRKPFTVTVCTVKGRSRSEARTVEPGWVRQCRTRLCAYP